MEQQSRNMEQRAVLFARAWIQVALVSVNTYFIANDSLVGILGASWMISFVWSYNVTKLSNPDMIDRVVYSTGAALGGLSGYLLAGMILK